MADFESRDTFALYEAMVEVDQSARDLAPELFFLEPIISRQKSKAWAVAVKVEEEEGCMIQCGIDC